MRSHKWLGIGGTLLLIAALVALAVLPVGAAGLGAPSSPPTDSSIDNFDCSQVGPLGINTQTNLRATLIRIQCGLEQPAGSEANSAASPAEVLNLPFAYGHADVQVNNALADAWPHVTQSESFIAVHGTTVVVNYNSSSAAPGNYSGISWSTDGGQTFTEIRPSPLATGHGTNYGDPIVWWNARLGMFFAGDLVSGGCGLQGIGLWTSPDGMNWTPGACAHSGSGDDRESMWVDNSPNSPHYGRMYISWNNFSAGQNIYVTYSDNGTTWSAPVLVNPGATFIRDVQLTGAANGVVFLAGMNEGGGGAANRQNVMYRSLNGGATWQAFIMGPAFAPPGDINCASNAYFRAISPIWRHMGWGQPGVARGVVHYAYAAHGAGTDQADIMYTRSTDGGMTWSVPIRLNTDATTRMQWMPSLAVTPSGKLLVTWYDRRNTGNNDYQYFGRVSLDNGLTWKADMPVSDVVIPQPLQPDPSVQSCYAGDYMYSLATPTNIYVSWTDGRVLIGGNSQQDVYFDRLP